MVAVKANQNQLNRRHAFRIYEQVDLIYQKINPERVLETGADVSLMLNNADYTPSSDSLASSYDQLLPNSNAQENDSLNVNISATGISFSCKDELKPGDYLKIRVLLLSSMTWVETCCKVVYCKPGNPFEYDHYPYMVGAHYVNLRQEDRELLSNHLNKKRSQQIVVNGLIVSLVLAILAMPGIAFDLILAASSFVLENGIEALNLGYTIIGYGMDHAVEAVFHTELRETQIISFYIQLVLELTLMLLFIRAALSVTKTIAYKSRVFYFRKKSSFLYYWREQTLLYKVGMISLWLTAIICYVLFFI